MDLGAVAIALLIALVVKLLVMGLGARLIFRVYGATYREPPRRPWLLLPPEDKPEVKLLWWSLVLFMAAELTCGVEIYVLFHSNPILTGTHAVVSSLGMALFALGLWRYLDKTLIRYADRGCIANRICRGCTVLEEPGCKFHLVCLLLATFVALACFAPFFVSTARMNTDMTRYILPFPSLNHWYDHTVVPWLQANVDSYEPSGQAYFLPHSMMVIEFRILPALALLLSVLGIGWLVRRRYHRGLSLVVLGFGLLAYVYLEMVCYPATRDPLIGSLGHEVVELWFLLAAAELLRRTFPPAAAPAGGETASPG